jgi:hypothetical protein
VNDRRDPGGGGMTGATGDLTPADSDDTFVPGERREIAGEDERARVTEAQGASTPAQLGETYDPAYPSDQQPPEPAGDRPERETRIGGDHLADHEERL